MVACLNNLSGNQLNAPAETIFPDGPRLATDFPNDSISAASFSVDSTENAAFFNDLDSAASPNYISTKNSKYSISTWQKYVTLERNDFIFPKAVVKIEIFFSDETL